MASQTSTVTLGTSCLEVTRDPTFNNLMELHNKAKITHVVGVFNQQSPTAEQQEWDYPYPTMTIINIYVQNEQHVPVRLELQDISNQPTWSTGLLTGIQQAIADINAWL